MLLGLTPSAAWANVGPPTQGGHIVAEPTGLQDVDVTGETLVIDLRPLANGEPAQVEATYHLQNRGGEKKLDLVFASGSDHVTDFQVLLGDRMLASTPANQRDLPKSWQPPRQTPGLAGREGLGYLQYGRRGVTPLAFTAQLSPGPQTLRVHYLADAARDHHGEVTDYWQFAYVLAPAREWARFGGLDLAVHLPEHWQGASTPPLTREGDTLRGTFADLPADALALTVQAPVGWTYRPLVYLSQGLLAAAGLGGLVLCWWVGRGRGRRLQRAWPAALGLGFLWALAVLAAGLFAVFGPDLAIPALQKNTYGYGAIFAVLGVLALSALSLPAGFGITLVTAAVVRHRVRRRSLTTAPEPLEAGRTQPA
jgi:hypothetical protein